MHLESVVLVSAFVEKKPMADLKRAFRKPSAVQAGNLRPIFTHPEVAVNNRHCRDIRACRDITVKLLSEKCCGSGSSIIFVILHSPLARPFYLVIRAFW